MDEQLDDQLKKRISEVFDDIGEPSAEEGWLKLREIYPERKQRRLLPWMWGAAAAVLLLLASIAIWLPMQRKITKSSVANQAKGVVQHPSEIAARPSPKTNGHIDKPGRPAGGVSPANRNLTVHTQILASNATVTKKARATKMNTGNFEAPARESVLSHAPVTLPAEEGSASVNQSVTSPAQPVQQLTMANHLPDNSAAETGRRHAAETQNNTANKTIADMFAADEESNKPNPPKQNILQLGIYAATYYNYAKGSENRPNAGGGITADFRLSKHLKIETGIMIAQNSLNFDTQIPTSTAQNSFAVPTMTASFKTASVVKTASVPAFKNYSASLVSLDIPVNIKYEFNLDRKSIYFLAGLSSGTFTNETYEYRYNYPALVSPTLQQTQKQSSTGKFDSFYFAKMLNLGVGFGYPLGKNSIVIEPFLKYPLDGLGSQYIRFGAGGINLKFNFHIPRNTRH